MDPLTHSLTGVAMARGGLARHTPLAMTTLVLAANLPDIDGVSYFISSDLALSFRRGWTHGWPAMLVLPALLTLLIVGFDRAWRRRRNPQAPPVRWRGVLLLAYLGTWTHPALDWLNTYGIRLLMPFDGTWFYGDTLFIIDPWLWLILGGAAFLTGSSTRRQLVAWGVLGVSTSAILLSGAQDQPLAWLLWFGALAVLVALRSTGRHAQTQATRLRLGQAALIAGACYIAVLHVSTVQARQQIVRELPEHGIVAEDVMAGPLPLRPLVHAVVIAGEERIHFGSFDWFRQPRLTLDEATQPRLVENEITRAAFSAPCLQGMVNWVRYPWVEIEQIDDGSYAVHLLDARYTQHRTAGFGGGSVELRGDLTPICE
ncbi:MAG: metal-dependent hydrolase [Acidobacteriota bacterium]